MEPATPDLLPCPCCGASPTPVPNIGGVVCVGCGLKMGPCRDAAEAVALWNKRPSLRQPCNLWPEGMGRIRREFFTLHIGAKQLEIDEIRNHYAHRQFEEPLKALVPPATAAELLWVADVLVGLYGYNEGMKMLMEIAKRSSVVNS
jgi:hypothetical protein